MSPYASISPCYGAGHSQQIGIPMEWKEFYTILLHTKGLSQSACHQEEINEPSTCDVPWNCFCRIGYHLQKDETPPGAGDRTTVSPFFWSVCNSFAHRLVMMRTEMTNYISLGLQIFQILYSLFHISNRPDTNLLHIQIYCREPGYVRWYNDRFTPRSLYPLGKSPKYPFDRRVDRSKCRSRCYEEEGNLLPLPGIETASSVV
jgi:hypothetical protein